MFEIVSYRARWTQRSRLQFWFEGQHFRTRSRFVVESLMSSASLSCAYDKVKFVMRCWVSLAFFFYSAARHVTYRISPEPVGFKAPVFNSESKISLFEKPKDMNIALLCQAQAFPVPVVRWTLILDVGIGSNFFSFDLPQFDLLWMIRYFPSHQFRACRLQSSSFLNWFQNQSLRARSKYRFGFAVSSSGISSASLQVQKFDAWMFSSFFRSPLQCLKNFLFVRTCRFQGAGIFNWFNHQSFSKKSRFFLGFALSSSSISSAGFQVNLVTLLCEVRWSFSSFLSGNLNSIVERNQLLLIPVNRAGWLQSSSFLDWLNNESLRSRSKLSSGFTLSSSGLPGSGV